MNFPDLPHLKQLQKDIWQWPKSRASVMVGAGFSLNTEPLPGVTTRFPTWRHLVRVMFDELHPVQSGETSEQAAAREERFNSANALRIASEYEAAFDRRKLNLLICAQNPDSDHLPGKLHHLLLQLPWADVFTTNYDTLLERTEVPGRTYQPVIKASELTTAFPPRIVKLHGSFPSQTPFIISEEDYRTYPRYFAPFVNSVQQSLLENSFVLIGFSGDDPNFLEWTGWIRDELSGNHAPIYLVGPLSLGNAERSLLARRGVTPIDLAPVFSETHPPNGIHAASIEWFLNSLSAARPPRPEKWPDLDRRSVSVPDNYPLIVDSGVAVPEKVGLSPNLPMPLSAEIVAKVATRWQFERLEYPGWVVVEEDKRSALWEKTKLWITPLCNFAKDWTAVDRILLFREINWRLETSMVPLFTEWIESFQEAVNELFDSIADGRSVCPSLDFMGTNIVASSDVVDAWFGIVFALLREARETYNADRWNDLKAKIDKLVKSYPQHSDRHYYEAALWAMWNVERESAKAIIARWEPSLGSPLAVMWKAGLLAELDELGEARTSLRTALVEIRRALRNQGQNIELLSLEGWCTYLLFSVETSLDFARHGAVRDEFWERWQELKAWDCSPWPHKDYFDNVLSASPPKPQKLEQKIHGFDPGQVTATLHFGSDNIDPYLPGFACIRLYEQVGIPMRLPWLNISGDVLKNACRWIAPFIGFWSPALLIRAGKHDDLTKGDFLSRTQVAAMDPILAKRLYNWCLQILERELACLTGRIAMGSAQESLLEVLPEVLSRLAFKVDAEELRRTFPLVLQFHRQPGVRSHIRLNKSSEPWFQRLFEAADNELLLEWLPDLIREQLFDEGFNPVVRADQAWPDPMSHFPSERGREVKEFHDNLMMKIKEATDWLIKRAASEAGEGRRRALTRLVDIYRAELMTHDQQFEFGELLWSQRAVNNLPDWPGFAVLSFLHLPAPPGIDVPSVIKTYLLTKPYTGIVSRDPEGRLSICGFWSEHPMIYEVSLATKPIVQIAGAPPGTIEWSQDETKQLYNKVREWWENDKVALEIAAPFGVMGRDRILNSIKRLGEFLARAVLPQMDWANEDEWQQLLGWLQEVREHGAYPLVALLYILLHRPIEAESIAKVITADLNSEVEDAVAGAAKALRHWIHLSAIDRASPAPSHLLTALIERVVFRRKSGIKSCLIELTFLIIELPEVITISQGNLLSASLIPWHYATFLPVQDDEDSEFHEAERPDLRVLIGRLAGALEIWHKKNTPEAIKPPAIMFWRDLCASDPLPEIRRAFNAWDHLKP